MTEAIIYVPADDVTPHAARCLQYCTERGYVVIGIVRGDWAAAAQLLNGGAVGVCVVARADHLDPKRQPRVEIAGENGAPHPTGETNPSHRNRRPRLL